MAEQSIPSTTDLGAAGFADARAVDRYFQISARGSTQRHEVVAGITTFMAMVYAVFVVPGMLGKAGFDTSAVFVAVCLTTAFGSLLMGLWAKLPIAIGWLLLHPEANSAHADFWATSQAWLLVAAGPATLIPLVCFNAATRHLPYTTIGR